jgi:hypothetical protein
VVKSRLDETVMVTPLHSGPDFSLVRMHPWITRDLCVAVSLIMWTVEDIGPSCMTGISGRLRSSPGAFIRRLSWRAARFFSCRRLQKGDADLVSIDPHQLTPSVSQPR